MTADRNGPALAIVGDCAGCKHLRTDVPISPGRPKHAACVHPSRANGGLIFAPARGPYPMPNDCPEIAPARRALAHTICHRCGKTLETERECYVTPTCYACLPPPAPLPVTPWPPGRERDRLVRDAREALDHACDTGNEGEEQAARAVLASLGVDEAGDDLQPGDAS